MVTPISTNAFKVDSNGNISLSGAGTGIDWQSTIDSVMKARQAPIDQLNTKISSNNDKISAFQDLQGLLATLQNSIAALRGAVSYDGSANDFNNKQAYASVSRTDGLTPSAASNLIGVNVSNSAVAESHDIQVLQVARAEKIASDSVSSTTTALGLTDGSTFTIEGSTITVSSTDTLTTLRDRINAANSGSNATGVSASIVTASSNQYYLVLSKATAGSDINISDTSGTPLQTAGILTSGEAPKNVLQTSQKAELYADGLLDKTNTTYESALQSSATATIGSSGTIQFNDGTTTLGLAYTSGQTISDLAANINGDSTLQSMGISASVVQEGAQYRLKIVTTGNAFTMTETGGGTALTDLGINNSRLLIQRDTNTITDLLPGVTLSLYQAEVGTNIHIDIQQDLAKVKTDISNFIDAYNAVKQDINTQTAIDPTTGQAASGATLFGNPTISGIDEQLSQIIGQGTQGVSNAFSSLAQIGIGFVDNSTLSDPTLADTLKLDTNTLDTALLNNPDDVKRLLAFDFSSSDSRVTMLGFNDNTTYNASGYTLNVAFAEQYDSTTETNAGATTLTQAKTNGPAGDGISNIAISDSIPTDHAFRYSYDSSTETLKLIDLTTGTSESVNITSQLDAAAGTGNDLAAGQTIDVAFPTLGTITLSGTDGFKRGTSISDGTLDTSGLDPSTTMTGGAVTTPTSGLDKATVDALIAAGAYDPSTGLLTLGVTSNASGEAHFDTASGIKFQVDGGAVSSDITGTNLDDGSPHTVNLYVNNGTSDVQVASLSMTSLASTAAGTGNLTVDLGTGLFDETNTVTSATSPMDNYLSYSNGSFDIRDSSNTLLGTVNYTTGESMTDLASSINAISGLSASVVSSSSGFNLHVTSDTSSPLTFNNDSGGLLGLLNITNTGNQVTSANLNGNADGSDNGTVTVSGTTLTATDATSANGLQLLYTGKTDASGISLNYTVGAASQLYSALNSMLDKTTGSIQNEVQSYDDQNTFDQQRITDIQAQLDQQRQTLTKQFINMETELTTLNSLSSQIQQTFAAMGLAQNTNKTSSQSSGG